MKSNYRPSRFILALAAAVTAHALAGNDTSAPPRFEDDVLPLFRQSCLRCHGKKSQKGGLDLRRRDELLRGGESGPAIAPGAAIESLLYQKIVSGDMPPKGAKLSAESIETIKRWIDSGAFRRGEDTSTRVSSVVNDFDEHEILTNVFRSHCISCHGKWIREAELDLRTRESILIGGKSGPALVPGSPEKSLVYQRLVADEMPPKKSIFGDKNYVRRVRANDIEQLAEWIKAGAPSTPLTSTWHAGEEDDPLVTTEERTFWSFQPPERPAIPKVKHNSLVRTPIDAFLLRKLEAVERSFSPPTERTTELRRVYFALTGLPPNPDVVEAYLSDTRSGADKRLVDRLLSSPLYGERWGKYWLDAAGYSDSHGKIDRDEYRPFAWRYRDYVIRSLNRDKPYDQFIVEQTAGDELFDYAAVKKRTDAQRDALVATGFLRTAPDATDEAGLNFVVDRMGVMADQLNIYSSTIMGLTLECARCHSHKYDPIPQRDYYRFRAIFQAAYDPYDWRIPNQVLYPPRFPVKQLYQRYLDDSESGESVELTRHNAPLRARLSVLQNELSSATATFQKKLPRGESAEGKQLEEKFPEYKKAAERLRNQINTTRRTLLDPIKIHALFDLGGEPSPTYVLRRGEPRSPGRRVVPGVPSALRNGLVPYRVEKPRWSTNTTGRRLALARWLTQPRHPLTARVIVNRIWQHHFGRGLVTTSGNFGETGARPTHPELLDWLATELVRRGWSLKAIHRLIVTSSVYRQSSRILSDAPSNDPHNVLLGRFPFRRLDAEAIRDSVLQVSGRLRLTPFGPPDPVQVSDEGEVTAHPGGNGYRRSIYLKQSRSSPVTFLETFDAPRMLPNCLQRPGSTVSTQALELWNSELVRSSSTGLADRVQSSTPHGAHHQAEAAYRILFARSPSDEERQLAVKFLRQVTAEWSAALDATDAVKRQQTAARRAFEAFCHTLLNTPEFVYVD